MSLTTRVRQTTTSTGTGDLVLGSAPATYVTFGSLYADGTWVPYTVVGGTQFEEGVAPVSGGTLQRSLGRVFTSSDGGDRVDFAAGTKTVDGFLGDHEVAIRLAAEKTAAAGPGDGGAGDASAANQTTQIAIEQQIRDGRPFNTLVDKASGTVTYVCEAPPGSNLASAVWRVRRITVSGSEEFIQFAGTGAFDQIANNRASLVY